MIQISVHRDRLDTFRRVAYESNVDFIESSDSGEELITVFLLCSGEEAYYLGASVTIARVDEIQKDIYRERK